MLTKLKSFSIAGISALNVEIEVDVSRGLPQTLIVGLVNSVIKESKERIKVAIKNSGFEYPNSRITVNLYPVDIKKEGTLLDLPIALGILASSNQMNPNLLKDFVFLGELGLDGSLKKTKGILISVLEAKNRGFKNIILPRENIKEASFLEDVNIWGAESLNQVIFILQNPEIFSPFKNSVKEILDKNISYPYDFSEVKGQFQAKRTIEVGVAGFHNLLMIGSPGSGKTMLAKRIPSIMPEMEIEEILETSKIYSALGLLPQDRPLITQRPFRAPHHTASDVALIGGGNPPRPGEVSLAHNGVLFLDELPEFHRDVLESLRQPLEDGYVNISRAKNSLKFPAKIMLVAAMNPCPCGYYTHPKRECRCSASKILKYLSKISGPLLDRIDIHVNVPPVELKDLDQNLPQETSEEIRKRVENARKFQRERFKNEEIFFNSQMKSNHIKKFCLMTDKAKELLRKAMQELNLSLRAYEKILKVARTIADLECKEIIETHHIAEAVQYRILDKELFR